MLDEKSKSRRLKSAHVEETWERVILAEKFHNLLFAASSASSPVKSSFVLTADRTVTALPGLVDNQDGTTAMPPYRGSNNLLESVKTVVVEAGENDQADAIAILREYVSGINSNYSYGSRG